MDEKIAKEIIKGLFLQWRSETDSMPQYFRLEEVFSKSLIQVYLEGLKQGKMEMRESAAKLSEKFNEGYSAGDDEYMLPVHIAEDIRALPIEEEPLVDRWNIGL